MFLNQPEFEVYTNAQELEEHLFDEQNDLMSLAIGSDMIQRETEHISQAIDGVYGELTSFVEKYKYFVQIHDENVHMKVSDFESSDNEEISKAI